MKKIILLIILIFIAALAFNIKTVPNYSNKYGFEIVTSIGYNKYQQGYCLSENRILPFKEKATRAILQFMDKKVVLHKKFTEFKCYKFGLSYCDYRDRKIEIGYYILDELTNENWHDVILSGFDPEYRLEADNHGAGYRKLFFEDLNATKVTNLEDYIAFDEDMRYAGFTRPILQYIGDRDYFLYLDKGFILSSKNNAIGANVIFFKDDYSFELNNLKKLKKNYESKTNIFLQNTDRSGQNIDNCGNIIYDINKRLEDLKPYA